MMTRDEADSIIGANGDQAVENSNGNGNGAPGVDGVNSGAGSARDVRSWETHRSGSVLMRGSMIPEQTPDQSLLSFSGEGDDNSDTDGSDGSSANNAAPESVGTGHIANGSASGTAGRASKSHGGKDWRHGDPGGCCVSSRNLWKALMRSRTWAVRCACSARHG